MTDILAGAEPFRFESAGKPAVLVLHGFTGTMQSMRYLGEKLHRRFGFDILGPRLKGHGTSPDDMALTGYRDWIGSAEAALRELGGGSRKVFITGLSMGGTLCLNLAARFPELVAGIVPINGCGGKLGQTCRNWFWPETLQTAFRA
ncbi:alpha/beta fold hydrolase [Ferrovibrio sp.]|uniref:alpha/beta hydrolase n=1 Tax=Ferrovibrio sp. TaxID=1917215 RepID=UPI00260BCFCE|nr:alpha/beta fold hydrolase [Ferrovibrio sp.]